jgi:hypothetical protein
MRVCPAGAYSDRRAAANRKLKDPPRHGYGVAITVGYEHIASRVYGYLPRTMQFTVDRLWTTPRWQFDQGMTCLSRKRVVGNEQIARAVHGDACWLF